MLFTVCILSVSFIHHYHQPYTPSLLLVSFLLHPLPMQPFTHLPKDVLTHVFSFLELSTLLNVVRMVCKSFSEYALQSRTSLDFSYYSWIDNKRIQSIVSHNPHLVVTVKSLYLKYNAKCNADSITLFPFVRELDLSSMTRMNDNGM